MQHLKTKDINLAKERMCSLVYHIADFDYFLLQIFIIDSFCF